MEKRSGDKVFDTILREEVRRLNLHLPKQRRSLAELLEMDLPEVSSLDGGKIVMRKNELEGLAAVLPSELIGRLQLPIVLIRRSDLGAGSFTILSGDRLEMYAVARLLGSFPGSFDDYKRDAPVEQVVYKPEVSDLIRKYHSLIIIGFGVPEGFHA